MMTKHQNLIHGLIDLSLLENSYKLLVYIKILCVLRIPTVGVSLISMREILWTWHQDMQAVDFMNTTRNSLQMQILDTITLKWIGQ